jgi:hypothetical protein
MTPRTATARTASKATNLKNQTVFRDVRARTSGLLRDGQKYLRASIS